jgi:PPOX class probable F420-dependent enzyme
MPTLPQNLKTWLDEHAYAIVTTLNPDGGPQSSVIWGTYDGDDVLFSTILGRRKTLNMQRDPRVSFIVYNPADPYHYVEVRGTVTITEEGGRKLINDLSLGYRGQDYPVEPPENVRVVCRLTPTKVVDR